MASKQIYFNTPQRLTQLIGANTTVIVAGRRTGKTDSIASPFVLRNMQRMPSRAMLWRAWKLESLGSKIIVVLRTKILACQHNYIFSTKCSNFHSAGVAKKTAIYYDEEERRPSVRPPVLVSKPRCESASTA